MYRLFPEHFLCLEEKQVFLIAMFWTRPSRWRLTEQEKVWPILMDSKKKEADKAKVPHLKTVSRRKSAGSRRICRERDGKIKVEWRHWGTAAEVCGLLNSYLMELVKLWSLWHWQTTGREREWKNRSVGMKAEDIFRRVLKWSHSALYRSRLVLQSSSSLRSFHVHTQLSRAVFFTPKHAVNKVLHFKVLKWAWKSVLCHFLSKTKVVWSSFL